MRKTPVLLILGLGHSGTTILDLTLGSANGMVGVGEGLRLLTDGASKGGDSTWQLLRDDRLAEITCTCGQTGDQCPLWSEGKLFLKPDDFSARANLLLDAAASLNAGTQYVIDSTPGGARYLSHLGGRDIFILHVIRDMRSWSRSEVKRRGIKPLRAYAKWNRATKRMVKELENHGARYFRLGYEEFALQPKAMLKLICSWLEVEFREEMLSPFANTNSHVISGNPFLRRAGQASEIKYDAAWLAQGNGPVADALASVILARRNTELVYGNGVV